jgi:hypothetical protein
MPFLQSRPELLPAAVVNRQYQLAVANNWMLVNDICASVLFVVGCVRLPENPDETTIEVVRDAAPASEVSARKAFLLSWTLNNAAAAVGLPERQEVG